MTDDRLLEELLRSPLDDMPERSVRPVQMWVGGVAAVLVIVVAALWMLSDEGEAPVETTPTGETVPGTAASGAGSTSPGDTGAATTSAVDSSVRAPDPGNFQEMVAIGDGRMLMFGGFVPLSEGTVPLEGTWTFDLLGGEWDLASPAIAPSPRYGHAMAFHPPTGRVVLFGGGTTSPRPCPRIRFCPGPEDDQLWQYDPATGVWENMTPAVPAEETWPIPRFGARFAYEPVTERLILFGGVGVFGENNTPNFWDDTWAYDPVANRWEDLTAPEDGVRPPGRVQYGFAWHEGAQRILMFGGDGIPDDDDNLWAFDPSSGAWEDLGENEPGEGPKDRWFHLLATDPATGRLVLIGGNGSVYQIIGGGTTRSNANLDEVWTWDPTEGWVAQEPFQGEPLVGVTGGGDPETAVVVAYAGASVWSYDVAIDSWTVVWERPEGDS